ncbi:MAG: hypothetical protein H0X64_09230 [Gemmatimonadaceae bacterium]|nr:hypothetical protein [Gemmatimonadaceae bacterium]
MRIPHTMALGALALAAACASAPRAADDIVDVTTDREGVLATSARWTGNLSPTNSFSGGINGATRQNTYGTVVMSISPRNSKATRVQLTFQAPVQQSTVFRWAVLPGRCGAGSIPLLAAESFPDLEVSSNGRGQLDTDIPIDLPVAGQHHVNVYSRGSNLADVVGCATLRFEAR